MYCKVRSCLPRTHMRGARRSGFRTPVESTGLQRPETWLRDPPRALQDPIHFEFSTLNCELRPGHVRACEPDAPTDRPYLRAGQFCSEPRRSFGNANSPKMSAGADKSFGIRTYEKCARNSFRIHTYKIIGLKASWNEHLQKTSGGPLSSPFPFHLFPIPSPRCLFPFTFCLLHFPICLPASLSQPRRRSFTRCRKRIGVPGNSNLSRSWFSRKRS